MGRRRVMLIRRFDRYGALPGMALDAGDDLLVTQPGNGRAEHRLATLDNALETHEMFTLSRARACQMIADIWRVVRDWRVYFERFGVTAAEINKIAPALCHIDEVSTPALRKLLP